MAVLTDEEAIKIYNHMVEIFGDNLPNLEHYPISFGYYVKLYKKYYMKEENENSSSV
jgi:hypothetical protein